MLSVPQKTHSHKFQKMGTSGKHPDDFLNCKSSVVETASQSKHACDIIRRACASFAVVGFDAEWKPTIVKGGKRNRVALLQIATPQEGQQENVFLFRLNILKQIPECLQQILEDDTIIKVGVSPNIDGEKIKQDYNVNVRSTVDLRWLFNVNRNLKNLAKEFLNIEHPKSAASSNWEIEPLTERQLRYAAWDALVAIELFKQWPGIKTDLKWSQIKQFHDLPFVLTVCCNVCGTAGDLVRKRIVPKSAVREKGSRNKLKFCATCALKLDHCKKKFMGHLIFLFGVTERPPASVKETLQRVALAKKESCPPSDAFAKLLLTFENILTRDCPGPYANLFLQLCERNNIGLPAFGLAKLWRDIFKDTMQPNYLPKNWPAD